MTHSSGSWALGLCSSSTLHLPPPAPSEREASPTPPAAAMLLLLLQDPARPAPLGPASLPAPAPSSGSLHVSYSLEWHLGLLGTGDRSGSESRGLQHAPAGAQSAETKDLSSFPHTPAPWAGSSPPKLQSLVHGMKRKFVPSRGAN